FGVPFQQILIDQAYGGKTAFVFSFQAGIVVMLRLVSDTLVFLDKLFFFPVEELDEFFHRDQLFVIRGRPFYRCLIDEDGGIAFAQHRFEQEENALGNHLLVLFGIIRVDKAEEDLIGILRVVVIKEAKVLAVEDIAANMN